MTAPVGITRSTLDDVVLDIDGLSVDYGEAPQVVHAVSDVSLTLHRGEVLGIAGESGSGKSTIAYAATRLLRSPGRTVAGAVRYHPADGEPFDLLTASDEVLRKWRWRAVSIVFQAAMNALNPVAPVVAQLTDVMGAHLPEMSDDDRAERAGQLLDLVGIPRDRLRSYPHQLSGGMRQRVLIAMALALNPEVVVLDEPTTALDVVVQRDILAQLDELRRELGFSIIFITHDLSLLLEIADQLAICYAGRVVEQGPAAELYGAPLHPYTIGLLGSFPSLIGSRRVLAGIPGQPPDLRRLPVGCAFSPRCSEAATICLGEAPQLVEHLGRRVACHARHPWASGWTRDAISSGTEGGRESGGAGPGTGQPVTVPSLLTNRVGVPEPEPSIPPRAVASTAFDPDLPAVLHDRGTPVLEARGLSKRFTLAMSRDQRRQTRGRSRSPRVLDAVSDVSLKLYPGSATALVGESGSGKSTVARLLCGLYGPTAGEILLDGKPVRIRSSRARRAYSGTVQMVFQDPFASLNPIHTIRYQLRRALRLHQRDGSESELEELLSTVSLTPPRQYLGRHPHELSGGQRQRVAVARALAPQPRVLLADEPVSMLDVSIRLGVLNLLAELKETRQLALLYITHDIASARYFAEEILVMYSGELVEGGPSEVVTQAPSHPYTQLLLSSAPNPGRRGMLRGIAAVPAVSAANGTGCRFAPRCPKATDVCITTVPGRVELGGDHWVRCHLYSIAQSRFSSMSAAGAAAQSVPN
jgi:peptide/nickel transport system ATP-binding protein